MAQLRVNSLTSSSYLAFHWEKGFMLPLSFLPVMGTSFSVGCHRCSIPISSPAKQDLTLNPNAYVKIILIQSRERPKAPLTHIWNKQWNCFNVKCTRIWLQSRTGGYPSKTLFTQLSGCHGSVCSSPVHDSSVPVCQPGPVDSQKPHCNFVKSLQKHSALNGLLWWVTRLHAGNQISSLEK